ncbi:MAG: hypothetical protein M1816_006530 [Peltula sp. TS41687]|nr:MAG: hypothetical protein M1816_006530 [Peltula sp. TS41687]
MRILQLLPLAVAATAIVIPDESTANQLRILSKKDRHSLLDRLPSKDDFFSTVDETITKVVEKSQSVLDDAISLAHEAGTTAKEHYQDAKSMSGFAARSWADRLMKTDETDFLEVDHHHPPHHGHDGHHCHKPNLTIYQLISQSKYTTKLAQLIDEDGDLVRVLNSTSGSNYTLFAPTDHAFEKIPEHHEKPSKDLIKKVLLYHVSPDFYPASRVLVSHTIPTLLKEEKLGGFPQRIRLGLSLKGLTLNMYSKVVAVNIFGTNGVIHAIDDILFLPAEVLEIIDFLPGQFSTLQLGLMKTGLWHDFSVTATSGQTFFAPTNFAFQMLGPKINAFLFSKYGKKYLKALLKYHVVSNQTLYSDAFYDAKNERADHEIPKGHFHVDLETLLDGRPLSVDVVRYGAIIFIKINGFTTVTIEDGLARDGVIQALSSVLIPPKQLGGETEMWMGEELVEEDLIERLAPYVEADDDDDEFEEVMMQAEL